jgi:uncharacterized membrane protein (UPF0127 family)
MSKKMILILALSIIGIAAAAFVSYLIFSESQNDDLPWQKYKIGNTEMEVQIADTVKTRADGLSGRDHLEDNQGMLFIFPYSGKHGFWMKDMNFNLDIIWIKDNKVVGISENVQKPDTKNWTSLETVYPPEDVNMVLEVNSGFSQTNEVKIGDTAKLSK